MNTTVKKTCDRGKIADARFVFESMNPLVEGGFMLQRRHYQIAKDLIRNYPPILNARWFSDWMRLHRECLVAAFYSS